MTRKGTLQLDMLFYALCPCGLTYQQFGMVYDVGNLVGLVNCSFSLCILMPCEFCNYHFIVEFTSPTMVLSWAHRSAGAQHVD